MPNAFYPTSLTPLPMKNLTSSLQPRWWASLFIISATLGARQAQAQAHLSIAPRIGVNFASAKYQGNNLPYQTSTALFVGKEAGGMATLTIQHVQLQTGLLYSQQGFELKGNYNNSTNGGFIDSEIFHQLNYLTLPLTVGYTQHKYGGGMQVLIGGYVSDLLGGHVDYNTTQGITGSAPERSQEVRRVKAGNSFQYDDNFYSRRFDAGAQIGAGYNYKNFLVQAVYKLGLTNLGADYDMNPVPYNKGSKYYNRELNISLAYLLEINTGKK